MKYRHAFSFILTLGFLLLTANVIHSQEPEAQQVTVISTSSSATGESTLGARVLEECIEQIPDKNSIEAVVHSSPVYLKGINGEDQKNNFVQVYTASIDVNYMLYQKELLILTTRSVTYSEPVMKVVDKKIKRHKKFTSDGSAGDIFAGRSKRQYYFSEPALAIADAKKRAGIWLRQQNSVLCQK